jgi:hypothetical protein
LSSPLNQKFWYDERPSEWPQRTSLLTVFTFRIQ